MFSGGLMQLITRGVQDVYFTDNPIIKKDVLINYKLVNNKLISTDKNKKTYIIDDDEDKMCCICYDKYSEKVNICLLTCKHHFHTECCNKWIKKQNTCPLCRKNL